MDKGKHIIDIEKKTVTYGHETKTMDSSIVLTTTIDFSKVDFGRLLKRAGDAELIAWRAKSGIKGLTTAEAGKFQNAIVDASVEVTREKHVETEEEKQIKAKVKELLGGSNVNLASLLAKLDELKAQAAEADKPAE
jgi:hypothetical protein